MLNKIFKICLLLSFLLMYNCSSTFEQNIAQPPECLPEELQNGIVAFYPFIDGSIADFSINGNNLSNSTSASPTEDREGNIACAFKFDYTNNEYLTYPNPTFLNDIQNGEFSISLWYYPEIEGNGLISRGSGSNCAGGIGEWSISLNDNNSIHFGINGYIIEIYIPPPSPPYVQLNEWYHLAVTSYNNDLKIYQDGVLVDDIERVICIGSGGPYPSLNVGDLYIGRWLLGKMDDIIIYNRLLNETEIMELYNQTPCCN